MVLAPAWVIPELHQPAYHHSKCFYSAGQFYPEGLSTCCRIHLLETVEIRGHTSKLSSRKSAWVWPYSERIPQHEQIAALWVQL